MSDSFAGEAPQYSATRLQQALAEDPRTTELGIKVTVRPGHVFLRGQVMSSGRRDKLAEVIGEQAPELTIHNEVRVTEIGEPEDEETLG